MTIHEFGTYTMATQSVEKRGHLGGMNVTSWQLIFLQSRVNNGTYDGDHLPAQTGIGHEVLGFKNACIISVPDEGK